MDPFSDSLYEGHSKTIASCFYLRSVLIPHLCFLHWSYVRSSRLYSYLVHSPFARGVVAAPVQNGGYQADYCYHGRLWHGLECLAQITIQLNIIHNAL